jgi:hypothetical protein
MQCAFARLSSVAYPAPQYFSAYLIIGTNFEKKKIMGPKMCVSVLSRTVTCRIPILRRNERDVIKIVDWCPVKCPLLLSDFNET